MRRPRLIALLAILFLVLGTASLHLRAYVLAGYPWGTNTVNYYVNPSNLYVSPADAIAAVQSAASNWNTQGGSNIHLTYAGQTSDASLSLNYVNEVFFRNDSSGYIAETYYSVRWNRPSGRRRYRLPRKLQVLHGQSRLQW